MRRELYVMELILLLEHSSCIACLRKLSYDRFRSFAFSTTDSSAVMSPYIINKSQIHLKRSFLDLNVYVNLNSPSQDLKNKLSSCFVPCICFSTSLWWPCIGWGNYYLLVQYFTILISTNRHYIKRMLFYYTHITSLLVRMQRVCWG